MAYYSIPTVELPL